MQNQTIKGKVWLGILFFLMQLLLNSESKSSITSQVKQLEAKHIAGQTFLTWQEVDLTVNQEIISVHELNKVRRILNNEKNLRYRIYRSSHPIVSITGLSPLTEVPSLTCWNTDYYGIYPKPKEEALRYVIEDGHLPLSPGTGLYVHNPVQPGEIYYAVTVVLDGKENTEISKNNTLRTAVKETVGQGMPVLQRIVQPPSFYYVKKPTLYYYVRWEAPPNASVENKPFDYLVAIPETLIEPAPVGIHLHGWGGNLNQGYGWWYNAPQGAILMSSNQIPYDWWTGYHERLWTDQPLETQQDWQKGVVKAYTQKRLLSFIDWMATKWKIDPTRTFTAGNSMGGSGSIMLALRFPERIAWAVSWVGIHVPGKSPKYKGSYSRVYGKPEWGVKSDTGIPIWDYFDDVQYLQKFPNKEIGMIIFSNGKNDGSIGWSQATEFFRALQSTKRPHVFVWGQKGHGQRAAMPLGEDGSPGERTMPLDIRIDQSLPAFTQSSLDENPGDGNPQNGDPQGQVNMYLYWETKNIVDEHNHWEMTIGIARKAPRDEGIVDVTPRRCQKFQAQPGEKFTWTNTSLHSNRLLQTGQIAADVWGLVTLERVQVHKGKNRISIRR